MKRKYIDRSNWNRIEKSNSIVFNTFQERFGGYASAIFVEKVHDKLICNLGKREFCLINDGYIWIQRLPIQKNWSVTTMFNEKNAIIQWYFDITKQNSIDANGQPFYDDLYLDVVVFPSGEVVLLDEDELKDALEQEVITKADFDLAYNVANEIMNGIAQDILYLSSMSNEDLNFFKSKLEINTEN